MAVEYGEDKLPLIKYIQILLQERCGISTNNLIEIKLHHLKDSFSVLYHCEKQKNDGVVSSVSLKKVALPLTSCRITYNVRETAYILPINARLKIIQNVSKQNHFHQFHSVF